MKTAIYARVSTADQQTLTMQIEACQNYIKARGWKETMCVSEIGSGAKDNRPKRKQIIDAAKRREIDTIIVWKLDRWGRSTADIFTTFKLFEEIKVNFVSVTDALDFTTTGGKAMIG